MAEAYIIDVVRTPTGRGKPGGGLAGHHPVDMLAGILRELTSRTGVDPSAIDDVYAGCVSQVGEQSSNIARNAVLAAGFPHTVPATTIDRQCGSSQQALAFAAHAIRAGAARAVIACGVESMSRVPMFSAVGDADPHGSALGLRFPGGLPRQGLCAERVAHRWALLREELDWFAAASHQRAGATWSAGTPDEIVHIGDGPSIDETIRRGTTIEALSKLEPAFATPQLRAEHHELPWVITAGNSSPLTDGAAAALVVSGDFVQAHGLAPRARFVCDVAVGDDPELMLMGVVPATKKALESQRLQVDDISVFEVNEAFAAVPLAWQREVGCPAERLNPLGGAIAYGHPLGASGIRLLGSLLAGLQRDDGSFGLQTMCEAGGMANATIIERV